MKLFRALTSRLSGSKESLASRQLASALDRDYSYYEELKASGRSVGEAADIARDLGKDWTFQVRMSRSVYGLSVHQAQKIIMLDRDPHLKDQKGPENIR